MRNPIRRVCKGRASLLAGVAASVAALLAVPSLTPLSAAPAGDEVFVSAGHVTVPGSPLAAFDISWIDPNLVEYMLADRSNAAIDIIPLILNPPVFQIKPAAPNAFAGAVPAAAGGNDVSGPNGIITFNDPNNPIGIQLWAGDGPTFNPACGAAQPCSTVKVFSDNGTLSAVIPTGLPGARGNHRADELCFAPAVGSGFGGQPGLVLIANDAEDPGPSFLSVIPTDANGGATPNVVSQKINLPFATGIEQCQWDGSIQKFLVSIPGTNTVGVGGVLTFTRAPAGAPVGTLTAESFFPIFDANCTVPQGMAIGPRQISGMTGAGDPFNSDILLGCNNTGNTNTVTVFKGTPNMITNVYVGQGGADEVWYNSLGPAGFQGHYFVAGGSNPPLPTMQVSVIDPLLPNTFTLPNPNALDQSIPTGLRGGAGNSNHSVAAWSGIPGAGTVNALPLLEVFAVPVIATQGPGPSQSTLCGGDAAKGCVAFFVISPPAAFPDNTALQNF